MGERKKFLIKGEAKIGGDFKEISEETTARSPGQAKLFIAWRLGSKRRKVFLGNCKVYEIVKKTEGQLQLNFHKAP